MRNVGSSLAVAEIFTIDATEPKRNFRFVASVSATEAYRPDLRIAVGAFTHVLYSRIANGS
jgi:hypothetical protein